MPSPRRTKALILALVSLVTLSLFLTLRSSGSSAGPKYLEQLKTFKPRSAEPQSAFPAAATEIENLVRAHTILIFSKTYCPYSKKAKALLLDQYKIIPPPFVVELDGRSDMAEMQGRLKELTGRATVPNVLVSGTSIGGGDDVEKLHTEGALPDTIRRLAGDRVKQIFVLKGNEWSGHLLEVPFTLVKGVLRMQR